MSKKDNKTTDIIEGQLFSFWIVILKTRKSRGILKIWGLKISLKNENAWFLSPNPKIRGLKQYGAPLVSKSNTLIF